MPKVIFIDHTGNQKQLEVAIGENLMRAATQGGISGIIGDCGGNMACATCHIFVDTDYLEHVGPAGDYEASMLEFTSTQRQGTSRLCCQIEMTEHLDGIRIFIPEHQE